MTRRVQDHFRSCGNVVYADVLREQGSKRSKGCGIVEFETVDEAVAAINTLHDSELDGRLLTVREDREDREIVGGAGGAAGRGGGRRQRGGGY